MRVRQLGSTGLPVCFFMADSTDHITGLTGLSPAVEISKNGGAFASPVGAIAEIGYGWYALAGNATDRNTLGTLLVHAEAEGADPFDMDITIDSYLGHLDGDISGLPSEDDIDDKLTTEHGAGDWGAGIGLQLKEYTLLDSEGNPVGGIECWATSDASGAVRISPVRLTNDLGKVVFQLDVPVGTHVWIWHRGASTGDEEVV